MADTSVKGTLWDSVVRITYTGLDEAATTTADASQVGMSGV